MNKAFVLPIMVLLVTSAIVSAGATTCPTAETTYVTGKVYQNNDPSQTVAGADVTVVCNGITKTATTDLAGGYSVQYLGSECDYGDSVSVSATFDSLVGDNETTIDYTKTTTVGCSEENCCLEVTLNVGCADISLIPEFGLAIGVLTALSAVGIFFVVRRK